MFLDNKYTKIYHQIIERAQSDRILLCREIHHILPRAMGGSNESSNLVKLTPREHYLCHALLPKMVSDPKHIRSMYAAFNMMHVDAQGNRYTSKLYEYYKTRFYALHSEQQKGRVRTLESRQKQSASSRGKPWTATARASKRRKPTAKPVEVRNATTREVVGTYESISMAAQAIVGGDVTTVWKMCEGIYGTPSRGGKRYPIRHHKGHTFRYVDPQEKTGCLS